MTRGLFHLILFTFISLCHPLLSQDTQTPPPEPHSLATDWWDYFDSADTQLDERIETTQSQLKKTVEMLSEENRATAESLIEKTVINLQTLSKLNQQPEPQTPTPKPIAKEYTFSQVIELNRTLRKLTLELKSAQDEKQLLTNERHAASIYLETLRQRYTSAETRDEKRLLLGLEVIATRSAIELTNKRIEYLNQFLVVEKEKIHQVNEEIKVATKRIIVKEGRLEEIQTLIDEGENTLAEAKSALKTVEIESALTLPDKDDPVKEANDQYMNLQVVQAQIRAKQAEINLILLEEEKALSKILLKNETVDVESLRKQTSRWKTILSVTGQQVSDWSVTNQSLMQSITQIISLRESDDQPPGNLLIKQQQIIKLAYNNLLALQRLNIDLDDTRFGLEVVSGKLTPYYSAGERWIYQTFEFLADSTVKTFEWLNQALFHAGKTPVTTFNILRFLLVVIFTIWISRLTIRGLTSYLTQRRRGVRKSVVYRVSRLVHYCILTLGFLIAFSTLGFDFTNLVLIAGALGVGLGFGLQSIFNNFVSGIIILFESYLRVGDFIELDTGLRGEIKAINFRSLIIRTNDGIEILIPNSDVINNRVVNWTLKDPFRRIHITFYIPYGEDKELVKKIVEEASKDVMYTLDRPNVNPPEVRFIQYGESSLEFQLAVWVNEKATRRTRKTRSAYLWAIDNALREHNITVPFPQRSLHIYDVLGEKDVKGVVDKVTKKKG